MKKRAVITGMGVVSSSGIGIDAFWSNIKGGKCGISKIERFDPSEMPTSVAAEIKDFDPQQYMNKKEARRMDRYTQYALAAADQAVSGAKIDLEAVDKSRMGVIIGSGVGGIETMENQYDVLLQKGADRVSPFFIPMMISNMAAGQVAIKYGAKGFNECVVAACASGSNAIGDAFKVIQRGVADIMIAGGAEAPITPLSLAGFCSMKAVSSNSDPLKACRPFDKNRDGFIMGEGSGILILEEYEHAKRRGAEIVAEIIGYGCTCDAYHITSPSPDGSGAAACMKSAIDDASVSIENIDYINAHGTSTPYNDKFETNAIKAVFKAHVKNLAVSSTKSMTGHLLGAAGAIEAIITALSLKEQYIPATINYGTPDPECDLDYVPNQGRNSTVEYALSNSLGFGGHNAALLLRKIQTL